MKNSIITSGDYIKQRKLLKFKKDPTFDDPFLNELNDGASQENFSLPQVCPNVFSTERKADKSEKCTFQ